jgi:hypothetical protein
MKYAVFLTCAVMSLAVILMMGCENGASPYRRYRLANGKVVTCASIVYGNAGAYLDKCDDGIQYEAQVNIEVLP